MPKRTFPGLWRNGRIQGALESFARSFGYHWAKKPGYVLTRYHNHPTMTTAGSGVKGFTDFYGYADKMSPLGNVDALVCADYCLTCFQTTPGWSPCKTFFTMVDSVAWEWHLN